MPLVFAGVCSHAPGITGRADQADPEVRDRFYAAFDQMRVDLDAARPDAVVVIGSHPPSRGRAAPPRTARSVAPRPSVRTGGRGGDDRHDKIS